MQFSGEMNETKFGVNPQIHFPRQQIFRWSHRLVHTMAEVCVSLTLHPPFHLEAKMHHNHHQDVEEKNKRKQEENTMRTVLGAVSGLMCHDNQREEADQEASPASCCVFYTVSVQACLLSQDFTHIVFLLFCLSLYVFYVWSHEFLWDLMSREIIVVRSLSQMEDMRLHNWVCVLGGTLCWETSWNRPHVYFASGAGTVGALPMLSVHTLTTLVYTFPHRPMWSLVATFTHSLNRPLKYQWSISDICPNMIHFCMNKALEWLSNPMFSEFFLFYLSTVPN